MWKVEFESHLRPGTWIEWREYTTYEEAAAAMVMGVFEDPSYQHRIREVKD